MAESSQSQHLEGWNVNISISISVLKSLQLITMKWLFPSWQVQTCNR
jgi:hypothetical protein